MYIQNFKNESCMKVSFSRLPTTTHSFLPWSLLACLPKWQKLFTVMVIDDDDDDDYDYDCDDNVFPPPITRLL